MATIDQLSIRKQNILRIWDMLCERPGVTRQALAEGTGLSLMSVSNLVDQLAGLEVLSFTPAPPKETPGGRRSAGRKAELISLRKTGQAWLVFDLTDEFFRLTALSLDLSTLMSVSAFSGDPKGDYLSNLSAFLYDARGMIRRALGERKIMGVAIVTPGPYDVKRDTVNNQRVPALNAVPIKALFREAFGPYDYYVDEDVKFAVRAFLPLSAKTASEVLFYVYIGEGVGGAAIHNENVLRGYNAVAGDVGQLRVDSATCESLLSLRVFAGACGLDNAPAITEEVLLANIAQLARGDADTYRRALMKSAETVGRMLHTVVWMLDPALVVIDCRYARPMEEPFFARVDAILKETLESAQLRRPRLLPVGGGMHSVTHGVAQVLSREWIARVV